MGNHHARLLEGRERETAPGYSTNGRYDNFSIMATSALLSAWIPHM